MDINTPHYIRNADLFYDLHHIEKIHEEQSREDLSGSLNPYQNQNTIATVYEKMRVLHSELKISQKKDLNPEMHPEIEEGTRVERFSGFLKQRQNKKCH